MAVTVKSKSQVATKPEGEPPAKSRRSSTPVFSQPDEERYARTLIFGPSGHGKTVLLGTANDDPRTSPMILLDYEGGTSSLVGRKIDIVKIRSWEDYNEVYTYLVKDDHPYKSIGLDSVSETHIMSLLARLDSPEKRRSNPDLLEQGDYGVALVQMRRLLRTFRDLPLHFFCTSLARDGVDPRVGSIKVPALVGSLADEAPGIFELVSYLGLTEDESGDPMRVLVIQNYPKLRTKIRLPIGTTAPDELVDPTITDILNVLGIK